MERYDVVVVGGGVAGVAAAVAASRGGARTCLVERQGLLGGMGTAAMVGTVCGLYGSGEGTPQLLNEGIAAEVASALGAGGATPVRRGRAVVIPYAPALLASILDRLVLDGGVERLRLQAVCAAVETTGERVTGLRVVDWRGDAELACGAVVDASGDAIVARLARVATDETSVEARQLSAIVFVLQHVEDGALGGPRTVAVLRRLHAAEQSGRLEAGCAQASFLATGRPGEVLVKLALDGLEGRAIGDELTQAAWLGRRRVAALTAFLAAEVPGFAASFASHVGPQVGVRETRRIVGRARLERDDVVGARKRDDGVARAAWPIELWRAGHAGALYEWVPDGDWYDVPRGCLEHASVRNLLAAGRCISATHEAIGSARVMGTCLAIGEAAGRLAAGRVVR